VGSAPTTAPRVAVVLINFNSPDLTAACLESLQRSSYPSQELIVVDNGSTDASVAALTARFPHVTVLPQERNIGFAAGNNAGIALALRRDAAFVWILNNDTVVHEDCLSRLVSACEEPGVGMSTGRILRYGAPDTIWYAGGRHSLWTGRTVHFGMGRRDVARYHIRRDVEFVSGCCMLVKRQLIEQAGAFDDRFFIYVEDADWSVRARRAGFRLVYAPDAVVFHHADSATVSKISMGASAGTVSPWKHYLTARNTIWVERKHAAALQRVAFALLFTLGRVGYLVLGMMVLRRWDKLRALLRGVWEGWTTPL
jgi:GT2 family glycosyltransferase